MEQTKLVPRPSTREGHQCPQLDGVNRPGLIGDEDCLFMDIYAPPGAEEAPVMFWLHGGGNTIGQGSSYSGENLAMKHGVVVVTINYRLGIFGFLGSRALRALDLAALELDPLPQTNNSKPSPANPFGEWNFLSMLFHNKVIDGFLGQQYAWNNPGAVPGSVTADTVAFFPNQELPYAILSAHDQPNTPGKTTPPPDYPWPNLTHFPQPRNPSAPWPSHHQGSLPFSAGVYWHQDVDPLSGFDPGTVLTPTIAPLPTATPKPMQRPELRPVTTMVLDGPIGPSPVLISAAEVSIAAINGRPDLSFVVSAVASGRVEKWTSSDWVDISTPPSTSSPMELLQLLQLRMVAPTDQLRWVPPADTISEQTAFTLIGWNGQQASASASTIRQFNRSLQRRIFTWGNVFTTSTNSKR